MRYGLHVQADPAVNIGGFEFSVVGSICVQCQHPHHIPRRTVGNFSCWNKRLVFFPKGNRSAGSIYRNALPSCFFFPNILSSHSKVSLFLTDPERTFPMTAVIVVA